MDKVTAGIVIIGNEILSGRTEDTNSNFIAKKMAEIGIDLKEIRCVPDNKEMIIEAVNSLRTKYNYVFTTGGIGPTHDDITADAIAGAFNVDLIRHKEIYQILLDYYKSKGEGLNDAREKMAYTPDGAQLLANDASLIPGFYIENVFTMAGIPVVMRAMLESALPLLKRGSITHSKSIDVMIAESKIAKDLEDLQNQYPLFDIGSYPFEKDEGHGTTLVIRGTNKQILQEAFAKLQEICQNHDMR